MLWKVTNKMSLQQIEYMDALELREPMATLQPKQLSVGLRLDRLLKRMRFYRDRAQNKKQWPTSYVGLAEIEFNVDMKYVRHGYELIMGNHITEIDDDNKQRMNILWKKYLI